MIRMTVAGYAPSTSTHSLALGRFRDELQATMPDIDTRIEWNVLDHGHTAGDLLDMVEAGRVTLCYFSTSYLVDRVPELAVIDMPFRFTDLEHAHAALDGELGLTLSESTEARTNFHVFGYWDNGFRHLTNRLRAVHSPSDCEGLRVRIQPSRIHERMVELWGAVPVPTDLERGIELIKRGEVDAQENPLANTMAYGLAPFHPHVSLTGHVYGARGLYAHAPTVRRWPSDVVERIAAALRAAIAWQRTSAAAEEAALRDELEREGADIVALEPSEREAFRRSAEPLYEELRQELPAALFDGD
jgi:TRAP-type C4-dicarboxylate transport system substrate-binding protein